MSQANDKVADPSVGVPESGTAHFQDSAEGEYEGLSCTLNGGHRTSSGIPLA